MHRIRSSTALLFVICLLSLLLAACSPAASPTATAVPPTAEPSTPEGTEVVLEAATEEAAAEPTTEASTAESAATVSVECTLLNLNTVTEQELMNTLPNFSSRMVREFFEYRPYVSIQQFQREIGKYVDDTQVAEWQAFVYVPVDFNNADAATLQQIPGVDQALADSLTSARPFADQQAFLDALSASLTPEQVAQASCYLAGG